MTPYQEITSLKEEIDRLKETIVRLKDRNLEAIQIGQATARAQERERLQGQIAHLQGELEKSREETASVREELLAKTRELADLQGSLNRGIKTYKEVMNRAKYADSQVVTLTLRKLLD